MTRALVVKREGEAFQARIFWLHAIELLNPKGRVRRVGFESGPKAFDDVWVEYEPSTAPKDQFGVAISREHIQCKWHSYPGDYGYADLTVPEFINANRRSLLERLAAAHAETSNARFKLLTNWLVRTSDHLANLVSQATGTIRLDAFQEGKTERSRSGELRAHWRRHLNLTDQDLLQLVKHLALCTDTHPLDEQRRLLNIHLENRGLRVIGEEQSSFEYDDIVFQWLSQERQEFDRASFRAACASEGLLQDRTVASVVPSAPPTFGVKSFEHHLDKLENRCDEVLDLVPYFDQRAIRNHQGWNDELLPRLERFLSSVARDNEAFRLALDAHTTLAYAAGSVLNIKCGRAIELEQRTIGRRFWAATDQPTDPTWTTWDFAAESVGTGDDLAVAVSVTHDVKSAVETFLHGSESRVGRLLSFHLQKGPGATSVACGAHAFSLAEALAARLTKERDAKETRVHFFTAAPNTFTFFLGQRQQTFGEVVLYEYEFGRGSAATYHPSLRLTAR